MPGAGLFSDLPGGDLWILTEKHRTCLLFRRQSTLSTGFKNKGMTFARREDLENVSQQYQPLVTIVEFQAADFTRLGSDKSYYPSKAATNRIGDAAGVSFLEGVGGTREEGNATGIKVVEHKNGNKPSYFQVEGHYRIIGSAQGERLKPDGTPRKSSSANTVST